MIMICVWLFYDAQKQHCIDESDDEMRRWRRTLVLAKGSFELISSQSTDISVVHKEFLSPHLICNICNFAFQKEQKCIRLSRIYANSDPFCKRNIFQVQVKQAWKSMRSKNWGGSSHLDLHWGALKKTRLIIFSVSSTQYVSQYISFLIFDEFSALLKSLTTKALPPCVPWKDWTRAAVNSFRCCNRTLTESDTTALQSLPTLPPYTAVKALKVWARILQCAKNWNLQRRVFILVVGSGWEGR